VIIDLLKSFLVRKVVKKNALRKKNICAKRESEFSREDGEGVSLCGGIHRASRRPKHRLVWRFKGHGKGNISFVEREGPSS